MASNPQFKEHQHDRNPDGTFKFMGGQPTPERPPLDLPEAAEVHHTPRPVSAERGWVGVREGAPGLAGHPKAFDELADRARRELGLTRAQIAKDYWLVSALHALTATPESCRMTHGETGDLIGVLAFAGGTSLVAAWGISERHSEDIDLVVFASSASPRGASMRQMLRRPIRPIASALGSNPKDVDTTPHTAHGFRQARIPLTDTREVIQVDCIVEAPASGLPLAASRAVTSIMGGFATAGQLNSYPELGGFEVLCVTPARTALNKLDALHSKAMLGLYRSVMDRGRDLYDLYRIALTHHGPLVGELIAASAGRIARPFSGRQEVPRPARGYGTSQVFMSGTEANRALKAGYALAVDEVVWGKAPSFAEAVEAAISLDSR